MKFEFREKATVTKEIYETLKKYNDYNFVTNEYGIFLSKNELNWKKIENDIIDVSDSEKFMIFNKNNRTIPKFIMGTVSELLENLNIKNSKTILSPSERKK